jgi:dethiobiotin synthetase
MTAVFVTGSGTDIGKTYVTAGLIRALRGAGRPVTALKPVASGFDPARPEESDAGVLLEALAGRHTIEDISPWRFRAPLSPDMAAAREGRRIEFDALLAFCRNWPDGGTLLAEGVGGVMVPLDEHHTVLDWVAALGWPVLVVVGTYLGAISHALTTVEVIRQRGLAPLALAVNESEQGVDANETITTLSRFVGATPIHLVPRQASPDRFARIAALIP